MPRRTSPATPIISITKCRFRQSDRLFLDTNVWLLAYGENSPRNKRAKIYSRAVLNIINAGCLIYTNPLVLSEFINVCTQDVRKRHNTLLRQKSQSELSLKEFRKTQAFEDVSGTIVADAQKILSHCQCVDSGLDIAALQSCLADYQSGEVDFNDAAIVRLCRTNNLTLMTDDADFACQPIPIITGNPNLLRR